MSNDKYVADKDQQFSPGVYVGMVLAAVLAAGLGLLWYYADKKQPPANPQVVFDPTDTIVKETCIGRTVHGPGWVIPILVEEKETFTVKVLDSYLADPHHGTAYIDFTLSYGVNLLQGLGAVRYEKINDTWYVTNVDALDVKFSRKDKPKEEKK